MSEAERQLKIARQVIEVALDWIEKADHSIRKQSDQSLRRKAQQETAKSGKELIDGLRKRKPNPT